MKTAMKKLLGLMLVAVLLVSAVPFQALAVTDTTIDVVLKVDDTVVETQNCPPSNGESATVANLLKYYVDTSKVPEGYELVKIYSSKKGSTVTTADTIGLGDTVTFRYEKAAADPEPTEATEATEATEVKSIKVIVKVDSSDNVVATFDKVPINGESAVVQNLLYYCWNTDWDDVYEFDHAWSNEQQKNIALTGSVNAGDTLYILVNKLDTSCTGSTGSTGSTTNKFPYKVYLHIFTDNKVDEPAKTIDITSGIALDGKVTLGEVKTVVKNYYTAKTSDGINYDGLYLAKGNWVGNFVNDTDKYSTIEDTNDMRQESEVHINVMITNATAKTTTSTSSSTADPSNPKTGDAIYMAMTVMGLSATALVAVYFFSKKRAIR